MLICQIYRPIADLQRYLLYEATRLLPKGLAVAVSVLDRGVFPEDPIRSLVPLPEPSALKSGIDIRRLRALTIERLEFHAGQGHTLQPRKTVISEIRELPLDPKCEVTSDTMEVAEDELFEGEIKKLLLGDKSDAYQLCRLGDCGALLRDVVKKRLKASPLGIKADWSVLLNEALRHPGIMISFPLVVWSLVSPQFCGKLASQLAVW